jgi:putative ABC transport system permease protein
MTLSLSTFTATLAQTLDHHMHDQTFYKVGADMDVMESGEYTGISRRAGLSGARDTNSDESTNSSTSTVTEPPRWIFLPVSEHLKIPGVLAASRIAEADMKLRTSRGFDSARFMGIDRIDFPKVAFWRRDFSADSLGALMNKLAQDDSSVLVSRSLLSSNNLKVGDTIQASTYQFDETVELNFRIVGVFDYFPTWYPQEGQLVVGNLDPFFEQIGGQFPYRVWLKIGPSVSYQKLLQGIDDLYHHMLNSNISSIILSNEQLKPQRQGFFGLLSVGFLALALLTVLGFLLYAVFSFQRRFIELGMLRAIGLSSGQMLSFLASELAFLFLTGLCVGTGLGVWVSNFFIPYLQVGNDMASSVPPFVVQIDWSSVFQVYILFGVLFIVALIILGILMMRMKIFQAVKLGEAV